MGIYVSMNNDWLFFPIGWNGDSPWDFAAIFVHGDLTPIWEDWEDDFFGTSTGT